MLKGLSPLGASASGIPAEHLGGDALYSIYGNMEAQNGKGLARGLIAEPDFIKL